MDISAIGAMESLNSVQSAIQMTMLSKAMNADAQAVGTIIDAMQQANPTPQIAPSFGHKLDILV